MICNWHIAYDVICQSQETRFRLITSATLSFRACTGFDGGFEVGEAIRRLLDCAPTGNLNINADEQYALAA